MRSSAVGRGVQSKLDEGGGGQQGGVGDRMIAQPGMSVMAELTSEQQVTIGEVDSRAQERMIGGSLAKTGGIAGMGWSGQPETLMLERVGRQRLTPGPGLGFGFGPHFGPGFGLGGGWVCRPGWGGGWAR